MYVLSVVKKEIGRGEKEAYLWMYDALAIVTYTYQRCRTDLEIL